MFVVAAGCLYSAGAPQRAWRRPHCSAQRRWSPWARLGPGCRCPPPAAKIRKHSHGGAPTPNGGHPEPVGGRWPGVEAAPAGRILASCVFMKVGAACRCLSIGPHDKAFECFGLSGWMSLYRGAARRAAFYSCGARRLHRRRAPPRHARRRGHSCGAFY